MAEIEEKYEFASEQRKLKPYLSFRFSKKRWIEALRAIGRAAEMEARESENEKNYQNQRGSFC